MKVSNSSALLLTVLGPAWLVVACHRTVNSRPHVAEVTEMAPVQSPQQAQIVAERYARQMDFPIGGAQPAIIKRFITPENDVVRPGLETEYKKRIREALTGKAYWMVHYQPKQAQLGGEYAFFIDEKTGAVLAHYAGR